MVAAPDIDWMASSFPPACCTLLYVFALQSCLPPSLHFCFEMVFLLPFMFFLSRCKWSGVLACISFLCPRVIIVGIEWPSHLTVFVLCVFLS